MKRISLFKAGNRNQEEFNKFLVSVQTSEPTCFMIKYPRKDYSPRIDECTTKQWDRKLHVIKSKPLFLELFVSNPTAIKNLVCDVQIDELNFDNEVIQSEKYSFTAGLKLDEWKWKRFEVKSKLDYIE